MVLFPGCGCCGGDGPQPQDWCCYSRPAGGQALCWAGQYAVNVEILGIEINPGLDTQAAGVMVPNLDTYNGGMPANPKLEVTSDCSPIDFEYTSIVPRVGSYFSLEAATRIVGQLRTFDQPDGSLKFTFAWGGYVGFIETTNNLLWTGVFTGTADGGPYEPIPVLEFLGPGSAVGRWPLWSGNYGGIGGVYCFLYGWLVSRVTIADYTGWPPPAGPPPAFQCFDTPPPVDEGWTATGDCHVTEAECSVSCSGEPNFCGPCEGGEAQKLWESTTVDDYTDSFLITGPSINSDSNTPTATSNGLEFDSGAGSTWHAWFGGPAFELHQYHAPSGVMFRLRGICGSADGDPGFTIIHLEGTGMDAGTVKHYAADGNITEWVNPFSGVRLKLPEGEDSPFFTGRYEFTTFHGDVLNIELRSGRQLLRRFKDCTSTKEGNPLP